ncbi:hypothetical protein [Paraburkholderia phenoliruptrix]|uniref:hypothetical protein n=1 Tax=Paraburkholderia phenoliruptrix TaxID=252970 RepID=UPI001C4F3D5D|nr:hypothetical protein [Paraburkholderia phenoliruptrix]MBW0449248.1 hypothetical protein [Paraburkholderia phenoliruptrix]MBW9097528.1 hypothetical protein [Paraburkholderia phenoliruptrix]
MPSSYVSQSLIEKAIGLYVRHCRRNGNRFDQPSKDGSHVADVDGMPYVALRNIYGQLAVYRVHPETRRMGFVAQENWPKAFGGVA